MGGFSTGFCPACNFPRQRLNSFKGFSNISTELKSKVYKYPEMQRIAAEPANMITTYVFGTSRNILLGAGLCYALERKEYMHIPLVTMFPSIYAGYHLYKHRDDAAVWLRGWSLN